MSIFPLEPTPPPAARQSRRRLPVILALAAGLVVLGLAAVVPGLVDDDAVPPLDAAAAESASPSASRTPRPVTLDAVRTFERLRTNHTSRQVGYRATPPVGGPHDAEWIECGAYDFRIQDEKAVHSLEHGSVWITYRPGLRAADVRKLARLLPEDSGIMSPHPGQRGSVVVTVWGAQLRLTGPRDPRLPLFLREYGDGHTSPEPFGSCAGGVVPQRPGRG